MTCSVKRTEKYFFLSDFFLSNPCEGVIYENAKLARYTSLKTGGNAGILCDIYTLNGLKTIVGFCAENNISLNILGFGTDILVSDSGVDGVVARLTGEDFLRISKIDDTTYNVGSRVSLQKIISFTLKNELSGVEWLSGIPGSLGGLISLNAGAFGHDISEVIDSITVITGEGDVKVLPADELTFSYRKGPFHNGEIIISAVLKFVKSNHADLKKIITEIKKQRENKFPHSRSAGCVFKNTQNIHIGELIDRMGLKNLTVGGAKISEKHANFIVTSEGAESKHIFKLINMIRQKIKNEFNINLEMEIKVWGKENE